ncbi:MAG: hypothetical protein ACUZ8E_17850 [Candidatus Anammoxibacter sp.]
MMGKNETPEERQTRIDTAPWVLAIRAQEKGEMSREEARSILDATNWDEWRGCHADAYWRNVMMDCQTRGRR